ncbi:gastrula zinc finger protein XlCGF26.1-like [Cydia strobilella]|uniref:gastrula zinc finger protein XlCGF26.1-like n=1 Tax=Cydia strobilella TaxID=1100964 RepID=UPI003004F16E
MCVKEKRECEDSAWQGVSAAAAEAGLYIDHEVKDELVLGPEEWLRPQVFQVRSDSSAARAREPCAMVCSVVLVRLRDDATVHTGHKPYTCEHCGKRFRIKSILRKHIQLTRLAIGPKQFPDFCDSTFESESLAMEHEKRGHGVTNCMSAKREYTTNCKESLQTHLKRHSFKIDLQK